MTFDGGDTFQIGLFLNEEKHLIKGQVFTSKIIVATDEASLLNIWKDDKTLDKGLTQNSHQITKEYVLIGRIGDYFSSQELQATYRPFKYDKNFPIKVYNNDQQLFCILKDIKMEFRVSMYEADLIWVGLL
uniref:Staygreen domain-containing protein n=1 Tax=Rhabditophanes sp. KR3021 TaxID=114890 RepID=A0AC35U227_9BILA